MMHQDTQGRIEYLDAIRGIAALSVLFYHILSSHWEWMIQAKLGMMIFNGSDAVAMFFVLSGLVLSYKIFKNGDEITTKYYKRFSFSRIFRLYPAFLFMLIIYYLYEHNGENYWELFKVTFISDPHSFWKEAMLIRGNHNLFLPDWTLGIEMALSLLVPFMAILARYNEKLFVYLLIISILIGRDYISEFVLLFGLGVLISKNFDAIYHFNNTRRWWYKYRWALLPVVLFLYSIRHVLQIFPLPETLNNFLYTLFNASAFTFTGIAAALILVYIINSHKLRVFFSHGILTFIGKISYGIYLSHWLFNSIYMNNFDFIMTNYAGHSEIKFLLLYSVFSFTLSILSGIIIFYVIELPFIKLGKRILYSKD